MGGGQTRTTVYTGYDLPVEITANGMPSVATERFGYAPDRSLFKRVEGATGSDRIFCTGFEGTACAEAAARVTTYFVGNLEIRRGG
jgi:hypothetical protein